jgi:hypothetical protein
VNAVDHAVPRLVGVAEREHVARHQASGGRHLPAEVLRPVLGQINRVERRRAVHEDEPLACDVPAEWA